MSNSPCQLLFSDTVEQRGASVIISSTKLDDEESDSIMSQPKPTGKVVGIVRRRWRPYCGVLVNASPEDRHVLFSAQDERIPYVRLKSLQTENLINKQIVVGIDAWPSKSRYPVVCKSHSIYSFVSCLFGFFSFANCSLYKTFDPLLQCILCFNYHWFLLVLFQLYVVNLIIYNFVVENSSKFC